MFDSEKMAKIVQMSLERAKSGIKMEKKWENL